MRNLMAWPVRTLLGRRMPRLADHGERGAVAVLVTVLIGTGVLFGMGALVVDVGQLYQNRAELQNGADAAALAVAKSCLEGTCTPGIATQYADANASKLTGHTAQVDLVCGSGALGSCPASTGKITDCPPAPSDGANYVDVHTSTQLASGSTLLPPVFARTLAGNGNYQGSTVYACAQAEWGAAIKANSLAFTLSLCAWNALTENPYNTEIAVDVHGKAKQCTLPSGLNLPGGFGWLTPTSSTSCTANINVSQPPVYSAESDPGNNITAACQTALLNDVNTIVYLPVFDGYTSNGSQGTYTLIGLAAFYLNGWMNMHPLADQIPPGMTTGQATQLCLADANSGSNNSCLLGYFTQGLVPVTNGIGGPGSSYFGANAVQLTG